MVGKEINFMKVYAGNRDDENRGIEYNDVEILCNEYELEMLINSLKKFENEIDDYRESNKSALGFAHMHFRDNNPKWNDGDADLVVYVDLNNNHA